MEIEFQREDRHLNVFHHYAGRPTIEDNVTRALMVLLSCPPGASAMLRCFLSALQDAGLKEASHVKDLERYRQVIMSCLTDLSEIRFNLQEHSAEENAHEFQQDEDEHDTYVVCIALTPEDDLSNSQSRASKGSRPDAVLRLTAGSDEEVGVVLTVETKLRSSADAGQVKAHASHVGDGDYNALVVLPWQELYAQLRRRPEFLNNDPIIKDFDEFIASMPRLTGWTGIRPGDLVYEDPYGEPYRSRIRVQQMAHKLVEDRDDESVERQRGSKDFTINIDGDAGRVGNIGLACWSSGILSAKIVAGSAGRKEIDRCLKFAQRESGVSPLIEAVKDYCETVNACLPKADTKIKVKYRLQRAQEFKCPDAGVWPLEAETEKLKRYLGMAFEFLAAIHPSPGSSAEKLTPSEFESMWNESQELVPDYESWFVERQENEEKAVKWRRYGMLVITTKVREEDLLKSCRELENQLETYRDVLDGGRKILETVAAH